MASGMTRKLGPLPVWAWGILGGITVYFLYTRYRNNQASSGTATGPTASVLDPNAVDPSTGLTYGQEAAGAPLPGNAPVSGAIDQGLTPGPAIAGDLSNFDSELGTFLTAMGDFQQLAGALGYAPPNPSTTAVAAAQAPPVANAHGPKATPTSHHKQRTIHVKHPGSHQHAIGTTSTHKKPEPRRLKTPAAGGAGRKITSGSHQSTITTRSSSPRPATTTVHRGGPAQAPPKATPVRASIGLPPVRTPGRKPPAPVRKRRR
jgi:hypothetical protein